MKYIINFFCYTIGREWEIARNRLQMAVSSHLSGIAKEGAKKIMKGGDGIFWKDGENLYGF